MTTTTTRAAGPIDLFSPTRLASAPRLLVTAEQVRAQLAATGESTSVVTEESEGVYNDYAALLLCTTPKTTRAVPDAVTAPGHYGLTQRMAALTGSTITESEAIAVGQVLGIDRPSMTALEGRWLWDVCEDGVSRHSFDRTARPREWSAFEERTGLFIEWRTYLGFALRKADVGYTDPRVAASPHPEVEEIFSGKLLEFGGDWMAIRSGLEHGFTGRAHRLAIELMIRLDAYNFAWSPRLVRDTLELVIYDRRYRLTAFPGTLPGKVRLRIIGCVPVADGA